MRERETVSVLRVREKKRERGDQNEEYSERATQRRSILQRERVRDVGREREMPSGGALSVEAFQLSQIAVWVSVLRSRFPLIFKDFFFSAFQDFFSSKVDPRVQRSTKASDSFQRRLNLKRKSVRRLPELSFTFWLKWTHVVFHLGDI